MSDPNDARQKELEAQRQVKNGSARVVLDHFRMTGFSERTISDRTIDALLAAGVLQPEALVQMSKDQVRQIPGLGNASFKDIRAYHDRFRPRA